MKNPSRFPKNNLQIDSTEPGSAGNPGGCNINRNAHSREEAPGHAPFDEDRSQRFLWSAGDLEVVEAGDA